MFGSNTEYLEKNGDYFLTSNFKFSTLTVHSYGDDIKKDETRGVCGLYEEDETHIYSVFVAKPEGKNHL